MSSLYQYDAFLSHKLKEGDRAQALGNRLKQAGVSVWMCEEQGIALTVQQLIGEGLKHCRYIVVALTHEAAESPWVQAEINYAIAREHEEGVLRLIPVLPEGKGPLNLLPLLLAKTHIDPNDPAQFAVLVRQLREPTILEYREECRKAPVVSGLRFNGNYHVEPSDFLRVELNVLGTDPAASATLQGSERIGLDRFRAEFIDAQASPAAGAAVLLGEAGAGKTTVCKYLCRELAEKWTRGRFMPVYLPLGEMRSEESPEDFLNRQVGVMPFERLDRDVGRAGGRLFLFADGWNEAEPERWRQLQRAIRNLVQQGRARIVVTSRPVASAEEVWPGEGVYFFQVCRWSPEQTRTFFTQNGQQQLLDSIPAEFLDCLRLPLLAVLLLRAWRGPHEASDLRTVADVFAAVVAQSLGASAKQRRAAASTVNARRCLEELAWRMTRDRTVVTEANALEGCIPARQRSQFGVLLARLVASGLLRCADGRAALDATTPAAELRPVRISFLHQALQEYLTAMRCLRKPAVVLPPDIAHDVYWREVPVYMIQARAHDVAGQAEFVKRFLNETAPDYATAARLVGEIDDPSARRQVEAELLDRLRENLEQPRLYPFAIETFQRLGNAGRDALRKCLQPASLLARVFARAEFHLVGKPADHADEETWRRLGRSVYLLGELGDPWLVEHLADLLPSVCSLHLLYHVGEALLTVARTVGPEAAQRAQIEKAGRLLGSLPLHDDVTRGYAAAVERQLGTPPLALRSQADRLGQFLREHSATATPHFRDEFWRRAHGAEAFAELAEPAECVAGLAELFETEEKADYGTDPDGDFRQVQSSILKAALRSCELHGGPKADWRSLLERVFESRRVADNGWACRHLERLLLRWFTNPRDLAWLASWSRSQGLGGDLLRKALSNVLWLQGDASTAARSAP